MKRLSVWAISLLAGAAIANAQTYTFVYTDYLNTVNDGQTYVDTIFPDGTNPANTQPLPRNTRIQVTATVELSNPDVSHGAHLAPGMINFVPTSSSITIQGDSKTYSFVEGFTSPWHSNPGENPSELNYTDIVIFDASNTDMPGHYGTGFIEDPWYDGSGMLADYCIGVESFCALFPVPTNSYGTNVDATLFSSANLTPFVLPNTTFSDALGYQPGYYGTGFSPGPGSPLGCFVVYTSCRGHYYEPIKLLGSDGNYYWLALKHGDSQILEPSATYPYKASTVFSARAMHATHFLSKSQADFTVWRPSAGTWWTLNGITNQLWGLPGDIPVPGDYDGDGKTDYAIWRPSAGTWFIIPSSTGVAYTQLWGLPGDTPVPGDYDGDGKTDFAIWRPSGGTEPGTWWILLSSTGTVVQQSWGVPGDIPVPADYDGDKKTDLAVWRPSTGTWYVWPSSGATPYAQQWGRPGDVPLAADYDGDGQADWAIWRPATGSWYVLSSKTSTATVVSWGVAGDIPIAGDFDGDGKADYAVWRPSTGTWYIIPSATPGGAYGQQWGAAGDMP